MEREILLLGEKKSEEWISLFEITVLNNADGTDLWENSMLYLFSLPISLSPALTLFILEASTSAFLLIPSGIKLELY